jgi:serine/threonine protein kinase
MLLRTDVPSRCLVLLRCIALQELMKRLQRAEYTLPDTASKELADFLALMIQPDPTKRLGAEEALKHPWVLADDQTEEQVDVSAKQASSCKRYPPCRLAHQLPACQLTFLVRSPPVSLVSYRIVSYRIVSYRIVSYRIVIESNRTQGLLRQMSSGPIATISDGESPELWMGKLEACRQAADAARDVTLTGGASAVRLAEEGVPGEAGASAPEPSAVTFDDSDSD